MKHKLFSLLLALLMSMTASVLFTSCDDELEGGEATLVGTWCANDGDNYGEITFYSNHTCVYTINNGIVAEGEWTLCEGTIQIVSGEAEYVLFFDGKQLKSDKGLIYTKKSGSGTDGGDSSDTHDYVDLGLPSGTLWATCNIGASSPEDYGDYFAWGETTGYNSGKTTFNWSTYKYCNGSNTTLTKYNKSSNYGTVDNKMELELADDAAYVNWGSKWRMPSLTQLQELVNSSYTTTTWTTQNGVYGRKITSKSNGNSIFLPAAGRRYDGSLYYAGSNGDYWSRTSYPYGARGLGFDSSGFDTSSYYYRCSGLSVRPVRLSE